jgi:hypothetical protein
MMEGKPFQLAAVAQLASIVQLFGNILDTLEVCCLVILGLQFPVWCAFAL